MKITIETQGNKYTAEFSEGPTAEEVCEMLKGLLVQAQYHPQTVDEIFDHTMVQSWFTDSTHDGSHQIANQVI